MKKRTLSIVVVAVLLLAALWIFLRPADRETGEAPPSLQTADSDVLERGRDLVQIADCQACHTARGGASYAGQRAIPTPFGTFYSPNITPDLDTGIGRWSVDDFWHALHNGYGKNGSPLYPTFPYTNYTKISRRDADAMFAYLRTQAPVRQQNLAHDLAFPYNQRPLLWAWRALFFRPGVYEVDSSQSAEWNRGAYLTQGLAHCSACHEARNSLGAIKSTGDPSGGLVLNWYAPALTSSREAGLQGWSEGDIVSLLKTGQTHTVASGARASTLGPMAEVVYESLQHVHESELQAMAVYLKSLPDVGAHVKKASRSVASESLTGMLKDGSDIYARECSSCHGERAEGKPPAAPALAGNRAVCMDSSVNPIRVVLYGGYAPGTTGNPRPFGMPPFFQTLSNGEVASVLNYVRLYCDNSPPRIFPVKVDEHRSGPLW